MVVSWFKRRTLWSESRMVARLFRAVRTRSLTNNVWLVCAGRQSGPLARNISTLPSVVRITLSAGAGVCAEVMAVNANNAATEKQIIPLADFRRFIGLPNGLEC